MLLGATGGGGEIEALVREALPMETFAACEATADAISLAHSNRIVGLTAAIFIFDFRNRPANDVAGELKRISKAFPQAELLVVAEPQNSIAFAACLQIVGTPDKLTFLLAPLHRQLTVETLRAVTQRHKDEISARQNADASRSAFSALELQIQELRARLDIAKHAARHDDLTGALNRTGFVEELTARLSRDRQSQNVLMIDLDRFKAVNDTLGHSAGDDLVRKICTGIQSVIPSDAVLARLGGDEFGVVVEAATDVGIANICANILKVCAQTRYILGHEVQVSASIGVARQGSLHSEMELMRQADLALYAAKREGPQSQPGVRLGAGQGDQVQAVDRERPGARLAGR